MRVFALGIALSLVLLAMTEVRQMAGLWSIVVPEATQNLLSDPQFALADPDTEWNFFGDGVAADFTRETDRQWIGSGSAQADLDGGTYARIHQSITVTAQSYTLSALVQRNGGGVVTTANVQARFNTANEDWDSITAVGDGWYLCVFTGTPTAGDRQFGVVCNLDLLDVDAVQLEAKGYRTTYCDGEQPGCEWDEEQHTSTSTRSVQARRGGRVVNLDDYGAYVTRVTGAGVPAQLQNVQSYALLPGALHKGTKVQARSMTLVMEVIGSSRSDLHDLRQALYDLLKPHRNPDPEFVLRYEGATLDKEIVCIYEAGLEMGPFDGYNERVALRVLCPDPYWYEVGESAAELDRRDSATMRYVAGMLDGVWSELGPSSAGGTVEAIAVGPEGHVYIGGNFVNWDGTAAADYVAKWNGSAWSALGTGMNGIVYDLAFGPDGTLYAVGAFTTADGGAANRIASWDGAAWSALGTGMDNTVYCVAVGLDGTLYAGGNFTTADGGAAVRMASWDGAAWSALGAGCSATVYALATGLDGLIYAGGNFADAGGIALLNYVASWDGSAWASLDDGMSHQVRGLAVGPDGTLYATGLFTRSDAGEWVYRTASWNGSVWSALGEGLDGSGYCIAAGPDGSVYVGGAFTEAGGIDLADRFARWTGSSWVHIGIDLPGAPTGYAVAIGRSDPVLKEQLYDVFIGFSTTGTAYMGGTTTVANDGTARAYPRIEISRSGGTSATLQTILYQTTGQELLFDYALLDGEVLTIDLAPGAKRVESDFFGRQLGKVLAASDFAEFHLQPGDNEIVTYVAAEGVPTVAAYMVWQDAYEAAD